jgi:hypothetical protein
MLIAFTIASTPLLALIQTLIRYITLGVSLLPILGNKQ